MIIKAVIRKDGKVHTGSSHAKIHEEHDLKYESGEEEGFITDNGEFVDRFKAVRIARECGQIEEKINCLYSYHIKNN